MSRPSFHGRLAQGATIVLLSYWALAAVLLPVQVWDSHVYNIARLRIAEWGGLFHNPGWNDARQTLFPWSFDAVHLPFLWLHAGYALPSFFCLVGVFVVIYRLVSSRWDVNLAWCCLLALVALPTLVYQGTSTKNDLAVVFGIACWVYAVWCYRREGGVLVLWFGAAGLAFAAGAKTSGLPLMAAAMVCQFTLLRGRWREMRHFACAIVISFALLGSIETFIYNYRASGHALGDPVQLDAHRNRDGVQGAVANWLRYFIGNQSLGVDAANPNPPFSGLLANVSETSLDALGLRDRGMRPSEFNERDHNLRFLKIGAEAGSDFSLLGALALWVALWTVISRRTSDVLWRISMLGWMTFLLVAAAYAWMPWNARFLLLPLILFTIVLVIRFLGGPTHSLVRWRIFLILVIVGAVYAPLNSTNRKPSDLLVALQNRRELELRERPMMGPIMADLRRRFPERRGGVKPRLLYYAGGDSWVFPLWELRGAKVSPVPRSDPLQANVDLHTAAEPIYLLVLDLKIPPPAGWSIVRTYAPDSALYQRQENVSAPEPTS